MKKKFKVTLVVFLIVVLGCFSNVFAATNQGNKADKISQVRKNARFLQSASTDDGVVGTSNLNGTADNSAKVGDQLTSPEIGWKRYNDSDSRIYYSDFRNARSSQDGAYNSDLSYSTNADSRIMIRFKGTKIRIICQGNTNRVTDKITIDGMTDTYSEVTSSVKNKMLSYKTSGLADMIHNVVIEKNVTDNNNCITLDAVDIDSTGYLIDPSATLATEITLNKATDSLTLGGTGNTDTLTATVTPDNATNKTIAWKSSDSTIATVDSTGKIIAQGKGTAVITATTTDGSNLSASCTVTVGEATNPTDNADKAVLNITMTNGQVKQYNVTMDTVNKFISWYRLRSEGSGDPFYEFDITQTSSPTIIKTDYVVFDKISSFEVDDYTK